MRSRIHRFAASLGALLAAGTAAAQVLPPGVRAVDDDAAAGGDGLSWAGAYRYLQDALADAAADPGVIEIRVAGGVYAPDRDEGGLVVPGDRAATFALQSGLAVRGGYRGQQPGGDPDERNAALFPSRLSGDLLGNDGPGWTGYGENSHHVVTAAGTDATAVLEAFTVSGGNAWESSAPDHAGGGILCQDSDARIADCTVSANIAHLGAGALVVAGAPVIDGCLFSGNLAHIGRGGAVYFAGAGAPLVVDSRFVDNNSYGASSVGDGGAIFVEFDQQLTLTRCTFERNTSSASAPGFANGGAVCSLGTGLAMSWCTFAGNAAEVGGAVWTGRQTTITNCLFTGNEAVAAAGVFAMIAPVAIEDSTFSLNAAAEDGGGLMVTYGAAATLTNCIFWGNTSSSPYPSRQQIHRGTEDSKWTASYTCIMGLFQPIPGEDPPDPTKFPGCIEKDPKLTDPNGADNIPGTPDDDARPGAGSPAIDAGNSAAVPAWLTVDLDGAPRRADDPSIPDTGAGPYPIVDMGAYEAASPCYPDCDGSGELDIDDFICFQTAFGLGCS